MKFFQLTEDDLIELERILPQLGDSLLLSGSASIKNKMQLRKVKSILSNVRWNYGPPDILNPIQENQHEEVDQEELDQPPPIA